LAATAASTALAATAVDALKEVRAVVVEHEEALGKLDAIAGDGDHGIGMRRGVDAAVAAAEKSHAAGAGLEELLAEAGEQWAERAGGTSGALWGAAVTAVGRTLGSKDAYTAADAAAAVNALRDAIVTLGKAEAGDKTMVDALLPFADTFSKAIDDGGSLATSLRTAAEAAAQAADATAALSPKKGRARPLAEKSLGHPDPGAVSFGLIARRVAEYAATVESH
jgi:dihydroxyacetone kinase